MIFTVFCALCVLAVLDFCTVLVWLSNQLLVWVLVTAQTAAPGLTPLQTLPISYWPLYFWNLVTILWHHEHELEEGTEVSEEGAEGS